MRRFKLDRITSGWGFEPEGAAFRRAVLFGALGVLAGIVAGLVEWGRFFGSIHIEFPIPGTDWVWVLAPYTITHGIVFGILLAIVLLRYGIARENHLTLITVAVAIAAFVASNVASSIVADPDEGQVETSLWAFAGVVEGLIFAGLTIAALAALYPLYRDPQKIFPVPIAGGVAGGLGVTLAFAILDPELEGWRDAVAARALLLAVYTGIMLAGTGAAIGVGSRPPPGRRGYGGNESRTIFR